MELGALVGAPALPAHGSVAAVVAAAPGSQVETAERREGWPALVEPALSPELLDSRVALADSQRDCWASIWPAS